jgi:hypothetical protein
LHDPRGFRVSKHSAPQACQAASLSRTGPPAIIEPTAPCDTSDDAVAASECETGLPAAAADAPSTPAAADASSSSSSTQQSEAIPCEEAHKRSESLSVEDKEEAVRELSILVAADEEQAVAAAAVAPEALARVDSSLLLGSSTPSPAEAVTEFVTAAEAEAQGELCVLDSVTLMGLQRVWPCSPTPPCKTSSAETSDDNASAGSECESSDAAGVDAPSSTCCGALSIRANSGSSGSSSSAQPSEHAGQQQALSCNEAHERSWDDSDSDEEEEEEELQQPAVRLAVAAEEQQPGAAAVAPEAAMCMNSSSQMGGGAPCPPASGASMPVTAAEAKDHGELLWGLPPGAADELCVLDSADLMGLKRIRQLGEGGKGVVYEVCAEVQLLDGSTSDLRLALKVAKRVGMKGYREERDAWVNAQAASAHVMPLLAYGWVANSGCAAEFADVCSS